MKKIHYIQGAEHRIACGKQLTLELNLTNNPHGTTCKKCRRCIKHYQEGIDHIRSTLPKTDEVYREMLSQFRMDEQGRIGFLIGCAWIYEKVMNKEAKRHG